MNTNLDVQIDLFNNESLTYQGRAYFSAPDVDSKVYVFSNTELEVGKIYSVKIVKLDGLDLVGEYYV